MLKGILSLLGKVVLATAFAPQSILAFTYLPYTTLANS
jgi:hypothetical protein